MSNPLINPNDVLPRSNLPGEAVQWGRALGNRVVNLEKNALATDQSVLGANRSTSASLASISDQLMAIGNVQSTLVTQQAQLSDQQTRLSETNQIYTRVLGVSSNASDFYPVVSLDKPAWANAAFVTGSMIYESGSTTREALLVTTIGPDYPGPQVSNYFVTSNFAVVQEPSQPAVATDFLGGSLRIDTYRNSMASGTGTLAIRQFVNITWIYDSNISPATEPTPLGSETTI